MIALKFKDINHEGLEPPPPEVARNRRKATTKPATSFSFHDSNYIFKPIMVHTGVKKNCLE